ncbi:MAG: sel1 repeat family protein, partial [Desulfobulbaceae bacterium]|nr:sel1 repeat family protein [Desulfobulbaceae bacterium]
MLAIVILIGLSAPARSQLDTGYEAFKRGDHTTAHRIWKSLADKGNSKAQYNLGVLYQYGFGVKRQPSEAVKWYLQAAKRGLATAQEEIGDFYASGQFSGGVDHTNAAKWLKKAAMQGRVGAQRKLGILLALGWGVPADKKAAIKWLLKAQTKGDQAAQKWVQDIQNQDESEPKSATEPEAELKAGIAAYLRGDYAAATQFFAPLA